MINNLNILCTICARGGSKGVKNKNIKLVDGIPLIAHTIKSALNSNMFKHVVVSSDDEKINEVAREYGAEVLFERPKELSGDKAAKIPVIRHALEESERVLQTKFDILCDLDATSPLRDVKDIVDCLEVVASNAADNVITASPARRSPYFNLVELGDDKIPVLSKPSDVNRRQDSKKCYDMNASIYVWKRELLLESNSLFHSRTYLHVMPEERSIDIDSELDFRIVSALIEKRI